MVRIIALLLVLLVAVGACFALGGLPTLQWLWLLPVCILGSALALGVLYFLALSKGSLSKIRAETAGRLETLSKRARSVAFPPTHSPSAVITAFPPKRQAAV